MRKLPSREKIIEYWFPILVRMGLEIDDELVHRHQCFICANGHGLERAHIKAKCEGGSDDVKNLHILCKKCHFESEFISGKKYWKWYRYRRNVAVYETVRTLIHTHK